MVGMDGGPALSIWTYGVMTGLLPSPGLALVNLAHLVWVLLVGSLCLQLSDLGAFDSK